jgi:hypothetical protein
LPHVEGRSRPPTPDTEPERELLNA